MFYVWRHGVDKNFQNQVLMKLRDPVNVQKLEDPEIQPLKRGVFNLKLADLDVLVSNIETIIVYSHYESDLNKRKVMDFIEYCSSETKHHDYLKNILKDYVGMRAQEKIKIVSKVLKAMFEDHQKDDAFEMKMYLDVLTNKLVLLFSLLNNRLMTE